MTTLDVILLASAAWVGGGLFFLQGICTNRGPALTTNSRAVVADLLRFRPAALVAAALFLAVWPAIWVGAHLARR
ncbi:hypothetical protein EN780_31875 [Mesorhizobium sp. M4B.F.Ca.ET.089.01.1.1]|uniref:hypothetical protein n=1 Tax=Mesorhizobium sp. M4B.F.Ca.ET.089.01.1.1 TaxID=2496662 RepID=UPI000FE3354E|nr:hypothetical protein [Mesorhizobium sp. M4B.F.Ca.ET.089.01.1.1]RWX60497.1 hypothetical protein EN780_31875 [Mesorhizobium sp. M4B.F.Ca.ET.089.01.1.1]